MSRCKNQSRLRSTCVSALAAVIALAIPGAAYAQRSVIVNGQRLSEPEIAWLEQRGCVAIPNGNYWLRSDGLWGYADDPHPRGRLGAYCGQRRPSLSERGLLYSPGELLR